MYDIQKKQCIRYTNITERFHDIIYNHRLKYKNKCIEFNLNLGTLLFNNFAYFVET